jgi:streptogramin lyase
LSGTTNAILRVNSDGTTTEIADLSAFQKAHPVASPEPDDFEPDGTWYSMVAVRGDLYAVEPNHGEVDRISPETGAIQRVVDISAREGHIVVLESMTAPGFPGPAQLGTGTIVRIDHSGKVETIATGMSFPTAMTFGPDGALYVSNLGFAGPGVGQILRVVVSD